MVRFSRFTSVALVVAAALPHGARAQSTVGASWPTATPASLGINAATLDSVDAEIRAGRYGYVDRLVVIRRGKLAYSKSYKYDYDAIYGDSARTKNALNALDVTGPFNYFMPWWHPTYRRGDLHTLQSVTKTVASVIIGVAITRGDFPSIDTPILRFFDTTAVKNIDDRKRRITVKHLLTMTGGFDWNENLPYIDPNNTATALEASPDWVQFTIDRPMMREPGTVFNYSSGESALLAHIFRQATGQDLEEYGAKHLFAPLGIERWFWKRTPSGSLDTEGGLYLEALDLARIWQLWLNGGKWGSAQVVSPDWVRESVKPHVTVGPATSTTKYGFKWWLFPDPADATRYRWSGSGFGGQVPIAFPELDLIIVVNAWNILPGKPFFPRTQLERIARATSATAGR